MRSMTFAWRTRRAPSTGAPQPTCYLYLMQDSGAICSWPHSPVVAACDRAHAWRVDDRVPPAGGQVAHFLIPAARMWDDVVYTCQNQRIFCSEDCVAIWLNESRHQRGSVLTCRRCGGSRGRFVRGPSRAWLCPPRAEHSRRLLAQCRALRHVLGPHLGVIDVGLHGFL